MAGHSQFKNIMHRKEAQDRKRAKVFTRALREITVAVRAGGADVATNARLRVALAGARQINMPKATIERAIRNATSGTENYEILDYEGFSAHNVGLIIRVMTDNRNRSACDVRTILGKNGGRTGDTKFLFQWMGLVVYAMSMAEKKAGLMEWALDKNVEDIQEYGNLVGLLTSKEHFLSVRDGAEEVFGPPAYGELIWACKDPAPVTSEDEEESLRKLIAALEDHDDVHSVYAACFTPLEWYTTCECPNEEEGEP